MPEALVDARFLLGSQARSEQVQGVRFNVAYCRALAPSVQGYLAHKKLPSPQDNRGALGMRLLWGPRSRTFLMSEVPI